MRTREEILAQVPLLFDVLCWVPCPTCGTRRFVWQRGEMVPCECKFGGWWERHSSHDTIPAGENVVFPTEAEDLLTIFPGFTYMDVSFMSLHATYRRLVTKPTDAPPDWQKAWKTLRRHAPMTVKGQKSVGPIPRGKRYFPSRAAVEKRALVARRKHSGRSSPIGTARAVQAFHVLYTPNRIETMDLKFVTLPPGAQAVMRSLLDASKEKGSVVLSRPEVYAALAKGEWVESQAWAAFIRWRPTLLEEGFVGEEWPPALQKKGKTGLRPYVRQQREAA